MKFSRAPSAKVRLFCFPFAGGGASSFLEWSKRVDRRIEVLAIQLPGRENRIVEEPYTSIESIVSSLLRDIEPLLDIPYIVYGHSMGTRIAFEMIHAMLGRGLRRPLHFFASGAPAPQLPRRKRAISELPATEFLQELRDYKGTPTEILENEEFQDLFLPMLRADFGMVEKYVCAERVPLPIPTSVFGGEEDEDVNGEELKAWRDVTNVVETVSFPGGHFFIKDHYETILAEIAKVSGLPHESS